MINSGPEQEKSASYGANGLLSLFRTTVSNELGTDKTSAAIKTS